MQIRLRKRLGDLLVEEGIVKQDQLEQALGKQQTTGRKLGDTLISMGFLSEQQMLSFLSVNLIFRWWILLGYRWILIRYLCCLRFMPAVFVL